MKAKTLPSKHKPFSYSFDSDKKFHSFNDEPAIVGCEGDMYWYKHGKLHRDNDKPAYIGSLGTKSWWKDGLCHRDNGKPAVIANGDTQCWALNGTVLNKKQIKLLYKINASEIKHLPWLLNEDELLNCVIEKRMNEES